MIADIEVRLYRPSIDLSFVFSTWLRNYKHSSYFAKRIKPVVFFKGHQAVVEHILKKPTTKVYIAHPKDDSETILGYLACEPSTQTVHFLFVKDAFRKMGIAKQLLAFSEINIEKLNFTHWTMPVDELIRKWPDITYNPYAM